MFRINNSIRADNIGSAPRRKVAKNAKQASETLRFLLGDLGSLARQRMCGIHTIILWI
jgi:hypothetical protein